MALVVTIVVLLILAAVSLNLVLGENGIISKAKEGRDKHKQAALNEQAGLADLEGIIDDRTIVSDATVIPDRYNTGCEETKLVKVTEGGVYGNIGFALSSDYIAINWTYVPSGNYTLENYDFTNFRTFRAFQAEKLTEDTVVIFNNCKFPTTILSEPEAKIHYIFNNCTFEGNLSGSNFEAKRTHFKGTVEDCTNAFVNATYTDCLFTQIPLFSEQALHLDGIQLFGRSTIEVKNIKMKNCRIIAPAIEPEGSSSSVNACIMLSLDYNNAYNISFEDMYINGGGYSIYSQNKAFEMKNISFRNIAIGCTYKYGLLYQNEWNGAVNENVRETDQLYVGSVWKEDDGIHLSVTNDTNIERKLRVKLSNNTSYEYTIEACPKYENLKGKTYEQLPFDKEIIIPEKADWIQCYEGNTVIRSQILK